jgi:dTDP-4-amino-4,6-dideoxygalactose transaminase
MKIPLLIPDMPTTEELIPWLRQIDQNRWYTNYGPLNGELERRVRSMLDRPEGLHVTTVANCTLGIELGLEALNLPRGAQVLIPALTFAATGTAVLRVGLSPLIADVDAKTWQLTPEIALDAAQRAQVDAVLPVSTFGGEQDTAQWDQFTRETGIPVIVDAAGAFGNQQVGDTTTVVYSLHATKSLGAGEGGIVATRSSQMYELVRRAANFGIDLASPTGNVLRAGTNAKLSEYHAAVALASIPRWERHKSVRAALYSRYCQAFADAQIPVSLQARAASLLHTILPVRLNGCRDITKVMRHFAGNGIGARRWYSPPLNLHSGFSECPVVRPVTNAEAIGCDLIGLPFYPALTESELLGVVDCLAASLKA